MQSADHSFLGRNKSNGVGRGPPPPVRPKPSALVSAPTEVGAVNSSLSTSSPNLSAQRTLNTATGNGTPGLASFGSIKKAFERHQEGMSRAGSTGYSSGTARGTSAPIQVNRTSNPRTQEQKSFLAVPSENSSRPRSVSTPANRRGEDGSAASGGGSNGAQGGSKNGIDNSQPDFGNLRARFQTQTTISNARPKLVRSIGPSLPFVMSAGRAILPKLSEEPTLTLYSHTIAHPMAGRMRQG